MKKIFITLVLCLYAVNVFAMTAEVSFTQPSTPDWTTCVLVDTVPSIEERLKQGTDENAYGQCTTTEGIFNSTLFEPFFNRRKAQTRYC